MALIIEDGTIVAGANSYVTDVEYVAYALARGISLSVDQTVRETDLVSGRDNLDYNYEHKLQGERVSCEQELAWPRYDVYLHGCYIASNSIPDQLKSAQMELAIESQNNILYKSTDGEVKKKSSQVGSLKIENFEGNSSKQPYHAKANMIIKPFLESSVNGIALERY